MKLGIIGAPEAKTLVHAKELGLDFVEFDLNPPEFFGRPLDEVVKNQNEIKKAIEETGVEVGAVGMIVLWKIFFCNINEYILAKYCRSFGVFNLQSVVHLI